MYNNTVTRFSLNISYHGLLAIVIMLIELVPMSQEIVISCREIFQAFQGSPGKSRDLAALLEAGLHGNNSSRAHLRDGGHPDDEQVHEK